MYQRCDVRGETLCIGHDRMISKSHKYLHHNISIIIYIFCVHTQKSAEIAKTIVYTRPHTTLDVL